MSTSSSAVEGDTGNAKRPVKRFWQFLQSTPHNGAKSSSGVIDLNNHILVLIYQSLVMHLKGNRADLARGGILEIEDFDSLAANWLGDRHSGYSGRGIDEYYDSKPLAWIELPMWRRSTNPNRPL
jgi:hypothetical protein